MERAARRERPSELLHRFWQKPKSKVRRSYFKTLHEYTGLPNRGILRPTEPLDQEERRTVTNNNIIIRGRLS
jgi:hypothetical protein